MGVIAYYTMSQNDKDTSRAPECMDDSMVDTTDEVVETPTNIVDTARPTTKQCSTCKEYHTMDFFVGNRNQETKTCKNCRNQNKRADAKRDKEKRREDNKKKEQKPERKEYKRKYNEEHYDKQTEAWLKYRQRKIQEDVVGYKKRNAEQAANWREKNPDKVKKSNEMRKKSIKVSFNNYKNRANYKNWGFEFDINDFTELVKRRCFYCDMIDEEKGFCGIDRMNSRIGYTKDNSVPCCFQCNISKGCLDPITYFRRATHIASVNGLILEEDGLLFPECFVNSGGIPYCRYIDRATKKGFAFEISEEDYKLITNGNCFYCHRESTEDSRNGIDRIDSEKGYILDNCVPCCSECNYMKNRFSFESFMTKNTHVGLQYIIRKEEIDEIDVEVCLLHKIMNENKKTKEQIKEEGKVKKQERNDILKKKHDDDSITERLKKMVEKKENSDSKLSKKSDNPKNLEPERPEPTEILQAAMMPDDMI